MRRLLNVLNAASKYAKNYTIYIYDTYKHLLETDSTTDECRFSHIRNLVFGRICNIDTFKPQRSMTFKRSTSKYKVYRISLLYWWTNLKSISLGSLFCSTVEKQQTKQWTSTEKNGDQKQSKGHVKERNSRKCRKSKTTQTVLEEAPTPAKEDKTEIINQTQDSLRWEAVLDDPVAEAERLEVYKANRRRRYLAFRQTLVENIQLSHKMDLSCNHGTAAKNL